MNSGGQPPFGPDATWRPEDARYIRPHEVSRRLRVRLAALVWWALPGRLQGRLCGCPICRGGDRRG